MADQILKYRADELSRPQPEKALRNRQLALLVAPVALTASTFAAYQWFVVLFGLKPGYFAGFLFYWVVWCLIFPIGMVGVSGVRAMFHDRRPRLARPTWLSLLLLAIPVLGGFFVMMLPRLPYADVAVIAVSAGIALVNGIGEEILWRGTYFTLFPRDARRGYLYPALAFGLWHLAPTSVTGNPLLIVSSATFLGLTYGWVAWRTGSIRWTTVFHALTDFTGLIGVFYLSV